MTAYALQGDREKCLAADMDGYLAKPARPNDIITTLNQLVSNSEDQSPTGEPAQTSQAEPAEQSAQEESIPVFDRQELLERLGGREELVGRFIEMFTRNVEEYMESLKSAIVCGDADQIRIRAHAIKGAAGNISARQVWKTASTLEAHAREGRVDEATALVQHLTTDLEEFHREVSV
jgi:HPt (histidine-containing phosphotransfer) domain-containing protein